MPEEGWQLCVDEILPLTAKESGDLAACHFPVQPGENLARARPRSSESTAPTLAT